MKASQFSGRQRAFILKQGADGMPVPDIRLHRHARAPLWKGNAHQPHRFGSWKADT
jgi:hypothetical protein